jgi:hypothetical protein
MAFALVVPTPIWLHNRPRNFLIFSAFRPVPHSSHNASMRSIPGIRSGSGCHSRAAAWTRHQMDSGLFSTSYRSATRELASKARSLLSRSAISWPSV